MANNTSEYATKSTCGQCQNPIWKIRVSGLDRKLDVELLSIQSELMARLEKRATFRIKKWLPTFYAEYRTADAIAKSAGQNPYVLAEHKCRPKTQSHHPDYFPNPLKYVHHEEPQF